MYACAYVRVRVSARVYARRRVRGHRRVRVHGRAYGRGHGTVCGVGMGLSKVGSCFVIVAWCNCCMCNHILDSMAWWFLRGLWWFRHADEC